MRRLTTLSGRERLTRRDHGKPSPARRRVTPRWLRPAAMVGGLALVVASIAGPSLWLWQSGRLPAFQEGLHALVAKASVATGLVLREVYVAGRVKTLPEAILGALNVKLGQPLMAIDLDETRRRLEVLGWIRSANVERRFPDALYVRLVERVPLALWQRKAEPVVIDREGEVIEGARPGRFPHLPLIVGDDAPAHAAHLIGVMASEPALMKRVAAAVRVGGRRWNLRLGNGIEVRLPEQDVAGAWQRLAEFDRRKGLLARDVTAVDLRLSDRLIVRLTPGAKARATVAKKGERT